MQANLRKFKVDKKNFDYLFVSNIFLPLWQGIRHGSRCADCFYAESLHSSIDGVLQGLTRIIPIKVELAYANMRILSSFGGQKKTTETFATSDAPPQDRNMGCEVKL